MYKVSINIVTWNSLTYLPSCLTSIYAQTFRDFYVLIIDNGSKDGSVEYIQNNFPQAKILKNTQNLGFSRAHNQGIKLTKSPYILVMNPDIILTPDYLEKIISTAEARPNYSAFGGKNLKYHFQSTDLREIVFTDKIDSIGLKPHKNRSFTNEGENELDKGQYDQEKNVFGLSGSLVLFKREGLEKAMIINEYFDEDFFVYKEDIDLAWRMQLHGLKALYIPEAVAYHHRQARTSTEKSVKAIMASRKERSRLVNFYSYRNHLLLLYKNEYFLSLVKYFPQIFWHEFKKFVYLLIFEKESLKAYASFFHLLPVILKKRRIILKDKKNIKKFISGYFK